MADTPVDSGPIRKPGVERWQTRGVFVAAAVALACGPAMVWRFPALALKHGGGNFLVAFAIALIVTGLPLLVLEFAVGQRTQRAAPRAFRITHRRQEWLGWVAVSFGLMLAALNLTLGARALALAAPAMQAAAEGMERLPTRDPVDFVFRQLHGTSGPGGWLFPPWWPVFALLLLWGVAGGLAGAGPRRFGIPVRMLLAGALAVLLAVVVRQLGYLADSSSGAVYGLSYALDITPSRLLDPALWLDAFTHALLACGVGAGAHVALAACLPHEADTANNGLFVALCSAALSFIIWLGIACMLGMLAMRDGRLMAEVASGASIYQPDGVGLMLLTVPQSMLQLDAGADAAHADAGWMAALFIALAVLALTSAIVLLHGAVTALQQRLARSRMRTALMVATVGFALTLALSGIVGWQWFDTADHLIVRLGLPLVALLQCVSLGWLSGADRWREQITRTSERPVGLFWELTVRIITPLMLILLLVNALTRLAA
ncbi:MAG: hypothetical protein AB7K09_05950 [Planctomycetota bacterium]